MNTGVNGFMRDVVIVGGGVAGLSAAWYAQQAGRSYAIIEASDRWGGKVHTDIIDIGHDMPLHIESAPDGFITRKPGMMALVRSLGIEDALIPVNATPERIYVLVRGKLHALPDGLHLLAPTKVWPFLRSGLFSWRGKLRMLAEPFIPAKLGDADESLADFITRRLGREALYKLGEPLLAGVYNAESHRQSITATFGNFRKIEAEHGSLIRGLRKLAQRQKDDAPALMSFRAGMCELIDALTARLTGDMRLNVRVIGIERGTGGYIVHTSDGEALHTQDVIIATPATVAAHLLRQSAPTASALLQKIRYTGVGSVSLAYSAEDVPRRLDAYGIVISGMEGDQIDGGHQIDGITCTSAKWPGRAPDGIALIRVFFGGVHTPHMLDLPDDERLQIIRAELRAILGIEAEPIAHHGTVWRDAYPQYDVEHGERVAAIESALPDGLHITGNAYHGVGLPDTVSTSARIIQKISEREHANYAI